MNPHEAGFAPDLADRLKAPAAELHGLVIMKDGRLVLEHYGKGEDHSWGSPTAWSISARTRCTT
ncbi:hypothetical protein ACFQGX_27985 [Nonomuraea dietziae]|uniref:hypothetical protein n=1 Tax=Nonomuraea dietziae TaxID=65515 RepID=UPI0036108407